MGKQEVIVDYQPKPVILSLCYLESRLGAAVYSQASTTVRILHDIGETDDFRILNLLFEQIEPVTVIACKSQDLTYVRYLSARCKSTDTEKKDENPGNGTLNQPTLFKAGIFMEDEETVPDSQDPSSHYQEEEEAQEEFDPFKDAVLNLMPSNAFRFDTSVVRISELFTKEALTKCEADIVLQFRIDTKSKNMVCAFGALLRYMDAARIGVEYDTLNIRTPISSVKTFVVDQMIEIDWSSYRALDIFGEDKKKEVGFRKVISPSFKGSVSLFSLMNRCRSATGKHTLMNWFSHPTLNMKTIRQRQQAVTYFSSDCNSGVTSSVHQFISKIRNVKAILKRMRSSVIRPESWTGLFESLKSLKAIGTLLTERKIKLDILNDYMEFFGHELTEAVFLIGYMLDFDESATEERLVVNATVDPELDEIKHIYRNLPQLMTQAAQEESNRLQADQCSVVYLPIVGFLLQLPLNFPAHHYPDLKMVFTADAHVNMKSKTMTQLDEEIGDVKMQIIDKETTIALRMQKTILDKSQSLLGACRAAAILDSIISMALTARHFNWNCPVLTDKPVIEAVRTVHPIAQMLNHEQYFVPNDVSFGDKNTKVKIFTGPNACGKSVYMKQVGLLAFLTYIGSYVPAQRAIVGPICRIMTRLFTVDGVLDGMSTFAKDLQQMALALRRANECSLVIIDEFGKGTLTEVGISLLSSALNYWLDKGPERCPHIMVSSHFHSLSKYLDNYSKMATFQTFEVVKRGHRLDYQFRLVNGIVNCSHAAYTAASQGIPMNVVKRSDEIYADLKAGKHPSELIFYSSDDDKMNKLKEKMTDFMLEFATWDIKYDSVGLLDHLETMLLDESENMDLDISSRMATPVRPSAYGQEEVDNEDVGPSEADESRREMEENEFILNGSMVTSNGSKGTSEISPGTAEAAAADVFAVPALPNSILKSYLRTPSKNNLSVSFAASPTRIVIDTSAFMSTQDIMLPVSPIKRFNEIFPDENENVDDPPPQKKMRF